MFFLSHVIWVDGGEAWSMHNFGNYQVKYLESQHHTLRDHTGLHIIVYFIILWDNSNQISILIIRFSITYFLNFVERIT